MTYRSDVLHQDILQVCSLLGQLLLEDVLQGLALVVRPDCSAHSVPVFEEVADDPQADVPVGTGDEDLVVRRGRRHLGDGGVIDWVTGLPGHPRTRFMGRLPEVGLDS